MATRFSKALFLGATFLLPATFVAASTREGHVFSWGFGKNGELGIGSEANLALPQLVKNIVFTDIDAKKSYSAGITKEGKIYTWGKNANGVLGHVPPNLNVLVPREVEMAAKVDKVSCGYQHMCAITKEGSVYVWGLTQKSGSFRQTRQDALKKEKTNVPVKINLPDIVQAASTNSYILLVDKSGSIFKVDDNKFKMESNLEIKPVKLPIADIKKVSCGIDFSLALTHSGQVYAWGSNTSGQLGTGSLKSTSTPVHLESLSNEKIVDICCGDNYSGVVTDAGEVYTWGFGNQGQLGHGDKSDQLLPRKIVNLKKEQVQAISCGGAHTALLTKSGKLLMMGRGREGQLGREQKDESNTGNSLLAKEVEQLPQQKIMKVACGGTHTLLLMEHMI